MRRRVTDQSSDQCSLTVHTHPSKALATSAAVSAKSFIDTTIPASACSASYTIRAHRGDVSSTPSQPAVVGSGVATQANSTNLNLAI